MELNALTAAELTSHLGSHVRAMATLHWLYGSDPLSTELPETIPDVSKRAWQMLRAKVRLPVVRIARQAVSGEGTVKLAVCLADGAVVETVLIPAQGRSTVCISSQAGCTRNCAFCATATLGFGRHLTAGEMVAQYRLARAHAPANAPARNVVFMGMGEPMDNLDQVLRTVEVLTQKPQPMLGAKQITVSTSGVLPGMRRFLQESRASLALSLNASTNAQRSQVMVQNKAWPIESLMALLREDRLQNPKRVHFIEYVLLSGLNDSDEDADRLPKILEGVNARVNLIPHNPIPGNPWQPPSTERILSFQQRVAGAGLRCLIRWPRGRHIAAACGQLALATQA